MSGRPVRATGGTFSEGSPVEKAGYSPTQTRILVVEDEGLLAADIQMRLEKLGYSVPATAGSGMEALQCARSLPFDLVLMDIRLKGDMDGIAAAQTLRTELQMPVLYMTAHSDPATVHRAMVTEPLGYLLKPIGDTDLRNAVQSALYHQEVKRRLGPGEAGFSAPLDNEINFLRYRLEVANTWPESDRKQAVLESILGRLRQAG
jgi:two-component system, response regulator PdtaR